MNFEPLWLCCKSWLTHKADNLNKKQFDVDGKLCYNSNSNDESIDWRVYKITNHPSFKVLQFMALTFSIFKPVSSTSTIGLQSYSITYDLSSYQPWCWPSSIYRLPPWRNTGGHDIDDMSQMMFVMPNMVSAVARNMDVKGASRQGRVVNRAPIGLRNGAANGGVISTPLPIKLLSFVSPSHHLDLN